MGVGSDETFLIIFNFYVTFEQISTSTGFGQDTRLFWIWIWTRIYISRRGESKKYWISVFPETFGFMSESTITSFAGKTLVVVNGTAIVACATLRRVPRKSVTSYMSWSGVKGTFRFSQNSPFDVTKTAVDLTGLGVSLDSVRWHRRPVTKYCHFFVVFKYRFCSYLRYLREWLRFRITRSSGWTDFRQNYILLEIGKVILTCLGNSYFYL